jgi:hypothetical protein
VCEYDLGKNIFSEHGSGKNKNKPLYLILKLAVVVVVATTQHNNLVNFYVYISA